MTDRIQHFTVFLEEPIRTDELAGIENALKMVRGVSRVERGTPTNFEFYQYASTRGLEIFQKLLPILRKELLGMDLDKKP